MWWWAITNLNYDFPWVYTNIYHDSSLTLLRANSFIRNLTVSSSFCSPILLTTASSLLSKSALMVSALSQLYPHAFSPLLLAPLCSLPAIHLVFLRLGGRLSPNWCTFLAMQVELFFLIVLKMLVFEIVVVDICHFDCYAFSVLKIKSTFRQYFNLSFWFFVSPTTLYILRE